MRSQTANKTTVLYVITNRLNGKRYVGITCKLPSARLAAHVWAARAGLQKHSALHKAIRKYGRDHLVFQVLQVFGSYSDAQAAEQAYIASERPEYNCTRGGDGCTGYRHTEEAKAAMSALKRGKPNHFKGKTHSPETRRLLSEKLKGKPGYWAGKKLPDHVVEGLRVRGAARREQWKAYRAMGPRSMQRPVLCVTDGKSYESATIAAETYGVAKSALIELCLGQRGRKTVGGRIFRYEG